MKFWQGELVNCDICHRPFTGFMVDGATRMGPWACMCHGCTQQHWTGLGQTYRQRPDGRWVKVG